MDGLTTIHLGGKLGSLFGKEWRLMVSSPAEAFRAIDANLGGKFRSYFATEGARRFYKVAVGRKDNLVDKDELRNRSGESDIYIMPTVRGSKSGVGKIIAGVVLIIVGAFTYAYGGAYLVQLGFSLLIGGIVQLLTPIPNFNQDTQGDSRGSNLFAGNAVAASQGGAVGIVYGRALVTPMPICLSFSNQDIPVTDAAGAFGYTQVPLPGGGFQWVPIGTDNSIVEQPQD